MSGAEGCAAPPFSCGSARGLGSPTPAPGRSPRSARPAWRAPVAEGSPRGLPLARLPWRPQDGPRDGVREVAAAPRSAVFGALRRRGSRVWKGSAARAALGQRESPGRAERREGAGVSQAGTHGPWVSPGPLLARVG